MTDTPQPSIGRRVASYRKLMGFDTAKQLAEAIPNDKMTASVIQNIESGRKADLSVSQLLDISKGLGVSPLVLLAPIGRPFSKIDLPNVSDDVASMTVHEFDEWSTMGSEVQPGESDQQMSLRRVVNYTRRLIRAVEEWKKASVDTDLRAEPFEYEAESEDGTSFTTTHDPSSGAWMRLQAAESDVRTLSTYLNSYNVDVSWVPYVGKLPGHG